MAYTDYPYSSPIPPFGEPEATRFVVYPQARPSLGEVLLVGASLIAAGYVGYKLFFDEEKVRRCSHCAGTGHTARNCPYTSARRPIPRSLPRTGNCSCCGRARRRTEMHHYAGRAADRWKEMCRDCHQHCGHQGDFSNFAINPRYCRLLG